MNIALKAKLKQYGWPFLILLVASLVTYWGLHQTFYQQDEWQELGLLRSGFISLNPFAHSSIWQIIVGQGRFFSDLLLAIFLRGFPFQMAPFAVVAIVWQAINALLVYYLTYRLTQRPIAALTAALFFAVNAVAHQSVIWMAAIATLPATSLILLAIISYLEFLETGQNRWFYWSLAATFASLFFKEIGIFLVILLPVLHRLWQRKTNTRQTLQANLIFLGYGLLIVLTRLAQMLTSTTKNGTITSGGHDFLGKVIVHLILYPLTGLFQTLVPASLIYPLAKKIDFLQYPFVTTTSMADIVPQTIITDLIAVIGGLFLVGIIYWLYRQQQQAIESRYLSLALLLTGLSFLPYAILDRGGSYMDSRYYYVAAIGVGMLIGYIIDKLWQKKLLGQIVAVGLSLLLLSIHLTDTRHEMKQQIEIAQQRRNILQTIKTSYPQLGDKNVFYVTGDHDYYIDGNKVPFQSGLGYILMVWYNDSSAIPVSFLYDKYLWDSGTQGYKEENGHGFGLFTDLPSLQAAVHQHQLSPSQVMAFNWDFASQQLTDISPTIQAQLTP